MTSVPMRQYKDFIFFERAEPPRFMREAEFDFARSEDKDATSDAKMTRLRTAYLAKARKIGAERQRRQGDRDLFRDDLGARFAGSSRPGWPPSRAICEALAKFAERAYRRPLLDAERDDLLAFYRELARPGRAGPRGRDPRRGRQRAAVAPLLLPHRPGRAGRRPSSRCRITPWPAG